MLKRIFNPWNLIINNCRIFGRNERKLFQVEIVNNKIEKIRLLRKPLAKKITNNNILDLAGSMLYPGFNDSHTHFMWMGLKLISLNFEGTVSAEDVYSRLKEYIKKVPPGSAIIGEGYDETKWKAEGNILKSELDKISPKNPVILRRVCGHKGIANTEALKRIPSTWKIVNRDSGELFEDAVLYIRKLFPPTEDELDSGLKEAIKLAKKEGVTSITDVVNRDYFKTYQRYFAKNKNPEIRVSLYFTYENINEIISTGLEAGFGNEYMKVRGIKLFTDGSIGAYTAAINQNFLGKKTNGVLIFQTPKLKELILKADRNNLQLMIHAIGDRAIDQVLSIFKSIDFNRELRHRLEHIELISDRQIIEMKKLDLIASMQPNFVGEWSHPDEMYSQRLPLEYFMRNNNFAKVIKAGLPLALGSDCMPFGPWYGIESAVNHPIIGSEISFRQAVKAYTEGSAFAEHEEKNKGKIKEGYLADLIYKCDS